MNRRSFFRSLARAAGIVALAPQLAFRVKPLQVEAPAPFWFQEDRASMLVDDNYLLFIAQLEAKTFEFPPSFQDFLRENRLHD